MNKSKFLKKSLAMLLALMLVFAMIPLSASAAPSDKFDVKVPDGQKANITETADGWNVAFTEYTATPQVVFYTSGSGETVDYVDEDGETQDYTPGTPVNLWYDDEDAPAPLSIKVDNNGTITEHTVYWSMTNATGSEKVSVASATMGDFTGTVDEEKHTIQFVVPYASSYTMSDVEITFNNATVKTALTGLTVETNQTKGSEGKIVVLPQNDEDDITYTVTAKQADALTYIKLGDYEGKFEIATADGNNEVGQTYNKGYETGRINFTIPASVKQSDLEDLLTEFVMGSAYQKIEMEQAGGVYETITNGEEANYSEAYNGYKQLKVTNSYGTRTYLVKFSVTTTDTTITEATATIGGKTYDGTVDGENIEIIVPANASLTSVDVALTGPVQVNTQQPKVSYVSDNTKRWNFDTTGKANLTGINYTSPIQLEVTSADGTVNAYYTLTITKAEAPQKNPQVTSAKVVLWPGTDNEYTATGSIDQSEDGKITFTVPYRTNDAAVKGAEYAFAKTSQTSWDSTNNPNNFANWTVKDGGKLGVASNDTDDAKVYTIVFDRMDPETGKSISNFSLSEADWEQLKPYNNNKTFDVTVSGTEFKVTLPDTNTPTSLYPDFTLSEGAALYYVRSASATGSTEKDKDKTVNGDDLVKVAAYDANGEGTVLTHLTDGDIYVIADEKLAYDIDNGNLNSKDYDTIKNTYKGNFVQYTLKVTKKDNTEHRLTSLSADDGKVQATLVGNDQSVIDLSVPASYAGDNTGAGAVPFYFTYTADKGAYLGAKNDTSTYELYSDGKMDVDADGNVVLDASATPTGFGENAQFRVIETAANSGQYKLQVGGGTSWFDVTATPTNTNGQVVIRVTAEDNTYTEYGIGKITVRDAETGASLTSAKVNGVQASIGTKAVNATLNYGANLGQVTLDLEADYMATIYVDDAASANGPVAANVYDPNKKYDFSKGGKIIVTSESGKETTEYTLNLTTGDMFSDVAEDQWYYDYVLEAAELGIVKGNPDGTFKPNDKVTRADFALMTVRMLGVDEDSLEFTTTAFTDVNDETYNAAAIQYCAEKGLIGGDGDGKFRPNDSITRQEAAKIIAEALELTETDDELFTDDNLIHEWAEDYVYQCKAAGIFGGDAGTGNFRPTDAISRAETAKIMVVAYNNK